MHRDLLAATDPDQQAAFGGAMGERHVQLRKEINALEHRRQLLHREQTAELSHAFGVMSSIETNEHSALGDGDAPAHSRWFDEVIPGGVRAATRISARQVREWQTEDVLDTMVRSPRVQHNGTIIAHLNREIDKRLWEVVSIKADRVRQDDERQQIDGLQRALVQVQHRPTALLPGGAPG
jgi:hypothetical protein